MNFASMNFASMNFASRNSVAGKICYTSNQYV